MKEKIIAEIVKRDLDKIIKEKKMIGWQRERIIKTYTRKVAAHPDGAVVHDGDCGLYNDRLGVCTCGLHHCLMASSREVIEELYPKYHEEKTNEGLIALMLEHGESGNLYYYKQEGTHGTFTPIKRPEPISEEKFNEIMDNLRKDDDEKSTQ